MKFCWRENLKSSAFEGSWLLGKQVVIKEVSKMKTLLTYSEGHIYQQPQTQENPLNFLPSPAVPCKKDINKNKQVSPACPDKTGHHSTDNT